MTQVNKYTDRAAYAADKDRLATASAISRIESNDETIYDGVNVVVEKSAAAIGDLAVFDKTAGAIRFIKGGTILKAQIPANLVPLAVVYARQGDKVLVAALENTAASQRWAHSYEVALSGFTLAAGGTFTLKINTTEYPFTYAAGATIADIAANIAANLPNYNKGDYGGWKAAATDTAVIMTSDTYSAAWSTIDVVSGCVIRRTPEDKNYQTTLTGLLIDRTESIRRKNRVNTSFAGCNAERVLQYYSVNGVEKTGQKPGSSEIIRESVFTETDNPDLVAAYSTYRDYIFGEHLVQYPVAYGTMLRDGKANTGLIGGLRFVDINGETAPCYPAAAAALDYGIAVEGATTGLEASAWWLPSTEEIYLLMRDRVLTAADKESDPVNRTLTRLGKPACYAGSYAMWTSCEYYSNYAFFYYGLTGSVDGNSKYNTYSVRPVSAL